jgi:ferritin-like metal-binding protein YciE
MTVESLQKMFQERLTQLYNAQRQLSEAYPRMAEAACSYKVCDLLQEQAGRAAAALAQLEEVHRLVNTQPARGKCAEIRSTIAAANGLIEDEIDLEVVDAGLVEVTHRLQHHVAQSARSVSEVTQVLGVKGIPAIIQQMLADEEANVERIELLMERLLARTAVAV